MTVERCPVHPYVKLIVASQLVMWVALVSSLWHISYKGTMERRAMVAAFEDKLATKPSDVYSRVEALELKLATTPADVLAKIEQMDESIKANHLKIMEIGGIKQPLNEHQGKGSHD